MKRRVEIMIDELVLHGFHPADRHAIGEALSCELERLANRAGADLNVSSHEALNAGMINLRPNAHPEAVGAQVGRAVFTSLAFETAKPSKSVQER